MATSNWTENRTKVWAWVIIIVLLLILFYALSLVSRRKAAPQQVKAPVSQGNRMAYLAANELPKYMPADIPVEKGATVVENYNAAAPNGQVQGTKTFLSAKTLQQNFDTYNAYLQKGNWKILSTINSADKPDQKLLLAEDATGILTVNITAVPNSKNTQVDLTYLKTK